MPRIIFDGGDMLQLSYEELEKLEKAIMPKDHVPKFLQVDEETIVNVDRIVYIERG